jgi:hypothetical protein
MMMIAKSNQHYLILLVATLALLQCASCQAVDNTVEANEPAVLPTIVGTPYPMGDVPNSAHFVGFTKRVYSALGKGSVKDVAETFKGEYETLNYDGKLGEKLWGLYEMRQDDLQIALKHAKKMREVLEVLAADGVAEAAPAPTEANNKPIKAEDSKKETLPSIKVQAAQAALSSAQSATTADVKTSV